MPEFFLLPEGMSLGIKAGLDPVELWNAVRQGAIGHSRTLDLVANQLVETPLVDGIETLRLEYGFDTDGNGTADLLGASLTSLALDAQGTGVYINGIANLTVTGKLALATLKPADVLDLRSWFALKLGDVVSGA